MALFAPLIMARRERELSPTAVGFWGVCGGLPTATHHKNKTDDLSRLLCIKSAEREGLTSLRSSFPLLLNLQAEK